MAIHSIIFAWKLLQRSLVGYSPWSCTHGSHDTLGNKHSHFLGRRLLWVNKQDCGAALVWKSRDKPPLLLSGSHWFEPELPW